MNQTRESVICSQILRIYGEKKKGGKHSTKINYNTNKNKKYIYKEKLTDELRSTFS
jgi:hypothetical protein